MTIYVGNLSFQAEREDLLDLFGQYGEVRQCSLPLDRETGRKRGFAFVELADDASEQKAIDDLQDVEWMGRMIRVNKATPREGGGGGGGGNRGGGGYGGGGNRGGGGGYGGGGPGNWNGPYGCSNAGGGGGGGSYVDAAAIAFGTTPTYGSAGNAGGVATSGAGGSGQVTVTFIATPTVPGAVTGLKLTDITTTSMTAYWTPPADDGGSALLGYDVTVGATTTRTTDPVFALAGLTPATLYTVNVKAVNAQGSSANASATATTSTPAATVPDAPTGPIVFSSVTSISITVSWAAPASNGGSTVLGYQVQVDGGSRTWTTSTTYTADFLTPHASHTFAVYAVNAVGASAALTGTQATGPTVPGTPTDLTFSAVTDTSITATWTPPTDNGGAAIDGYFIAVDGGASIPLDASTTSYTKTGLTAQTWYSFTVNAHNSQGNSGDLTGSQTTSAAANAPLLATTPATVGTSNAVTLTNYPGAEAETVYVNAPDGSQTTLTLTTSAGGSGSVSYTPTMAGTYTITTAPTPRTTTSLTSNAPTPGGGAGGSSSSAAATPATTTSTSAVTPVSTPSIGMSGVVMAAGPQRVMRVVYAYSGGAWRPVSGRSRAIPEGARVTVVTAATPASMTTRHLARAMRFARTLSAQVHRRTSTRWHGPARVVVTWRVPASR